MLTSLLQDLRYGLRNLASRPMFTLVAVLSLALGIGVNTAIFSLYHQVVLRPLPVPDAATLVNLSAPGPKAGSSSNNSAGPREDIFSYPMFRDLQREQASFVGIAAHRSLGVNIAHRTQTESGDAMLVSGSYFPVLGLQPALGRLLDPSDDVAIGASPVVVLSHAYWQNSLGGSREVLGQALRINGQSFSIVGVAPESFVGTTFGLRAQVFVPITQRWVLQPQQDADHENRQSYWVYLFARLKPGMSLQQAQTDLNGPYRNLLHTLEVPQQASLDTAAMTEFKAKQVELTAGPRGQSSAPTSAGKPLALLLAAAVLVLMIACLNIANLLLARGAARAGEIAVRASIGAGRARLVRQLLVEAGLLGALGALASLPLAAVTLSLLGTLIPVDASGGFSLELDAVALRFTLIAGFVTVLVFGLFPALQLARTEPIVVLRSESGRSGGSRAAVRFRAALAVAQIAFSMISLVLAGLFLQSLANLNRVELGMRVDNVALFSISPERNGYAPERSAVLFDRIEEELAAVPGVTSVAASMVPILSDNEWGSNISLKGFEDARPDDMTVAWNQIGHRYFETFSMPLLAGRDFQVADTAGSPKVAIVNRRFVERYRLGPNPIGQRLAFGGKDELDIEIVGLVEDSKYSSVKKDIPAQLFLPRRQDPNLGSMNFYVSTSLDPQALLPQLAAVVTKLDPDLPVEDLRTMPQQLNELLSVDRFVGTLAASFALLATLLAALGLYGVLSYTLAQRMREIGLRLALGAAPPRLRAMVMSQVGRLALIGGLLGLAAALALGHAARALLFGLEGHDPAVLAAASVLLALVAFGAGWLPARRVARIEPMVALRHE